MSRYPAELKRYRSFFFKEQVAVDSSRNEDLVNAVDSKQNL